MANLIERINGIEVVYQEGFAIEKNVEVAINSANNGLVLGMGEAGKVRKTAGRIEKGTREYDEFWNLCEQLNDFKIADYLQRNAYMIKTGKPEEEARKQEIIKLDLKGNPGQGCNYFWLHQSYIEDPKPKYEPRNYEGDQLPSIVQLECLRKLRDNNGLFNFGEAAITSSGKIADTPGRAEHIIHAVGMGYTWTDYTPKNLKEAKEKRGQETIEDWPMETFADKDIRLGATKKSVINALHRAYNLADSVGAELISVPVMCADRPDYGFASVKDSVDAFKESLRTASTKIKKIIYCAGRDSYRKFFRDNGLI